MNRSTILLILLLVVLGVIVKFLLPSSEERQASYKPEEINLSVDSASIIKVEIQKPGKSVTLENVGGKWMLTAPMNSIADGNAVKQIISGMLKFKVGSLVSSNVEKQTVFQVDTSGTKLTLTERSGKATGIIIGKMGPSYSEIYFRLPGSKDVYLGEGLESWSINKEVKDWRDKAIASIPSEAIKNLKYTVGEKEYEFSHDTSGWKSNEKPIDVNTMNPVLNSLTNLRADDFVDTAMALKSHPAKLEIHGNEDLSLSFFPSQPDSSKYYVQTSKSPQIFVVSKWTTQQLFKPTEKPVPVRQPVAVVEQPKKEPPPPVITKKEPEKKPATVTPKVIKQEEPKITKQTPSTLTDEKKTARVEQPKNPPSTEQQSNVTKPPATKTQTETNPLVKQPGSAQPASSSSTEDEGDLTIHTVKRNETMPLIAKQYNVTVEQILKWNLLKSIAVKPGQELYIFVRKK